MNLLAQLRATRRFCRVVVHLLVGLATIQMKFHKITQSDRERRITAWSLQMLGHLGIQSSVHGEPVRMGPAMLVSNHISWLDIASLHAACFCRFVSKADVKHWPMIGTLATGVGTLFIERESRRDAMRVVHHMAESLADGDILGIFPEGTTSDGTTMLPFHANLLQAAIVSNAPIQPVAMRFVDATTGQTSLAPCYIGEDTLMQSLWRTLKASNLMVVIRYGNLQSHNGRDRRTWARDIQAEIEAMRQVPVLAQPAKR